MSEPVDPAELVGRVAGARLLEDDGRNLPAAVGRPESLPPPSRARQRIVGLGATLTGLTLILGVALVIGGVVEAVSNAIALAVALIAVGVGFAGTHWGWVHVAELTANSIEGRRNDAISNRRERWLERIEPYPRHEVSTSVDDEGSIRIVSWRYMPVPLGDDGFTFEREVELEEVHAADEPGAIVTERAELLRHRAAAATERERERFEVARDAYEAALLTRDDSEQDRAARRAASQALSEQINTNLRDPPLVE